MKTPNTRFLTVTAALATVFAFVACAKSGDGSSSTTGTTAAVTADGSGTNASCNFFDSSVTRFSGKIATYYDTTNTFVESELRVRITDLTTSFDTAGYSIQFFRWKADSSGNSYLDTTPLTFTVYAGTQAISSAMTSINSTTVASLRSSTGIGTSSSDFFSKTTIVVTGVDDSWEVLKSVLYNGTTPVASADSLMPVFAANPNEYAANHPSLLTSLHPFYSQMSSGYTDPQWVNLSNQNCFQ